MKGDTHLLYGYAEQGQLERGRGVLEEDGALAFIHDETGGTTPLAAASENGHITFMELLLAKGADIHACNDVALIKAAANGQIEAIKALLSYGATVDLERHTEAKSTARQLLLDYIANPDIIPRKPLPPEPFTIGKWTAREKLREARNPIPLWSFAVGKKRDWTCKATWECRAGIANLANFHYDKECRVCGRPRSDADNKHKTIFPAVDQLHPDGSRLDYPFGRRPWNGESKFGLPTVANPDPDLSEYVLFDLDVRQHFQFRPDDKAWLCQHGFDNLFGWIRFRDGHLDRDWILSQAPDHDIPEQGTSSTASPQGEARDTLVDRIIGLLKERVKVEGDLPPKADDVFADDSKRSDRVTAWRAESRLAAVSEAQKALAERGNKEMHGITDGVKHLSITERSVEQSDGGDYLMSED
jgi:hypothetical protein